LMANLQALFRSLVSQEMALTEIVVRANQLFSQSTAANAYATLVAGRMNGGGQLELVNAGHDPPLLVRSGSITPLVASAPPLGIAPDARFESRKHRLSPQDLLFLYTDGLSEAPNGDGEEFGAGRIERQLADSRGREATDVVSSVLEAVSDFQQGTPPIDDVTAMAVRWRG